MVIAILLTLLVLALLAFLAMMPGLGRREEMQVLRTDYAHRGLHGGDIPENSPSAFAEAIRLGCGIELDVRLTADGIPMVFHDATLERVCGADGRISAMTREMLCAVSLPNGETIPTFAEVLTQVGGRVPLLIEIKGEDADCAICAALAELLDNYDGVFAMQSFNPLYLGWLRRNRPGYIRGLLYTNLFRDRSGQRWINKLLLSLMLLNFLARPDFVAYNRLYPFELPLQICRDAFGVPCLCWTVRDEEEAEKIPPDKAIIFEGFVPNR